ncbi:DUF5958 family protein [Microtetraspora malaysiensis]|uniref:DUF5958 family protein n=1 Tax=Microtetraspora malaysiensis TaxID=161358 RepID=UPI003D8E7E1D
MASAIPRTSGYAPAAPPPDEAADSFTPLNFEEPAFRLLIALLTVADGRRRERYCAGGCSHAWHQLRNRRS